jgi:hypothetical protein
MIEKEGNTMKNKYITFIVIILSLSVRSLGSHPFITNPGMLLEGFENVADWYVGGSNTTSANNTSKEARVLSSMLLTALIPILRKSI